MTVESRLDAPWKGRVAVVTLAHAVGTLNIMTVLAVAPTLQARLDLTAAQFGLTVSCYHGALACSGLVAGGTVDRLGVRWSLCIAFLLLAAGAAGFAGADRFAQAAVAAAFMGVGYGFINPCSAKGVHDWVPYPWRATAMAIKQTGVPLGGVLAAYGAVAVAWLEMRTVFGINAAATISSVGLCLLLPAAGGGTVTARSTMIGNLGQLLKNRNLSALNASTAGFNICQSAFFSFLTTFVREGITASPSIASLSFGLAQMASAVGRVALGFISDRRLSSRRTLLYILVGWSATVGLGAFALLAPGGIAALLAVVLLLGATIGGYAALVQTIVVENVGKYQTGAATGYHLFVIALGGMIGPPLFGWIVESSGSFGAGWAVLAVICLASTLILTFGFRAIPKKF